MVDSTQRRSSMSIPIWRRKVLPENKDKLLNEARSVYYRDHAVTVTLSPEDIASMEMIATHEDDLPKA